MKAFRKTPADPQALIVASKIHGYLKAKGNCLMILDTFRILKEYSERSNSYDFLWELIYIHRIVTEQMAKGKLQKAEYNEQQARFFTIIARIRPTPYNRCSEVIELVTTAIYYKEAGEREKASLFLVRAQDLYEAIDEVKTEKYYTAGRYLYIEIITSKTGIDKNLDEKLAAYKKLIKSAQGLFDIKPSNDLLSLLANACINIFAFKQFCYAEEKESIKRVLALLDKAIAEGAVDLKRQRDWLNIKVTIAEQG